MQDRWSTTYMRSNCVCLLQMLWKYSVTVNFKVMQKCSLLVNPGSEYHMKEWY